MGDTLTDTGSLYSAPVGLIYVFNLIVGTGALTLPKAFATAGWLLSLIVIIALAFVSYMTATFVIEAMATANAMRKLKREEARVQGVSPVVDGEPIIPTSSPEPESDETEPLISRSCTNDLNTKDAQLFNITERIEMGQMASMFFNKLGKNVFYISLIVYLYGDLAIYAAAVPKSLRDVACTYSKLTNNTNSSGKLENDDLCWPSVSTINRINAYRLFLAVFILSVGPFIFFNIQKTKYMQLFTTFMRWLAFAMMIILCIIYLSKGFGEGHPSVAKFSGVPNLFGICVYSFMCHHSLPSLATPIKNKSKIHSLFLLDYSLILGFYTVLSFTGIFTFPNSCLEDLYTLDFQPNVKCNEPMVPVTTVKFIQYYLALFPVFTLSSNFPIIGVTLRNNLKALMYKEGRTYRWAVDRLVFPLATIIPPLVIALITDDIQFLVGLTGSFAGSGIQYFVPASLVVLSRRDLREKMGSVTLNKHLSPFRHRGWPIFVFIWAVICIIFVAINHLVSWIHGRWD